jgi:hypothetical protein
MTPRPRLSRLCCRIGVALCVAGATLPVAAQPADSAAQVLPGPANVSPAPDTAAPASRLRTVITPGGLMLEDPAQPMLQPSTEGRAGGARRTAEPAAVGLPGVLHTVALPSGGRMRQLLVGGRDVQAAPASPSGAGLVAQALADGSHQWVLPEGPAAQAHGGPTVGSAAPIVDVPVDANGVPLVAMPADPNAAFVRYRLVRPDKWRAPTR